MDGRPDGSATIAWMIISRWDDLRWQLHVARIRSAPEVAVEFEGPVGGSAEGRVPAYEFPMVQHDASGRAFIASPIPGPGCQTTPVVRPGVDLNVQCVHLLREESAAPR